MQNPDTYTVEQVEWLTFIDTLRAIRMEVFIVEQQVPQELEWDDQDELSVHVLALATDDKPVGTGRLLTTGQIGRMAVLKPYRHLGVGTAILHKLMQIAEVRGQTDLFLNAQVDAMGFYQRFGFVVQGPVFMEAGIPHRKMVCSPGKG